MNARVGANEEQGPPVSDGTREPLAFPVAGETLLAAIVESSEDAIISKDLQGIVRSWNKAAERMFGYSAEEIIGKPIALLAPPAYRAEMAMILERLRTGERIQSYETVRRRKNGELLTVSLSVSPIRNSAGEIVGASKIARDLSAFKSVEQDLQRAKRQVEDILGSIRETFIALDRNWRLTYANGRAVASSGVSREELIGRNLWEFMPEAKDTACWPEYHRVMNERIPVQFEVFFPSLQRWYEVHAYPTEEGLSAMLLDITERYVAQQQLRESEQQRRLITDSLPVLISYIDSDECYQFNNLTHGGWLNIDPEELKGRRLQEVLGDAAYSKIEPYVKAVLAGEPQTFETSVAYNSGNDVRWIRASYVPDHSDDGKVRGFFSVVDDITARVQMEEKLRKSQELFLYERERLARVLEQAPVGIAVLRGEDLVYELANPPYQAFLPNRELVGRALTEVIPELDPDILRIMQDVIRTGVAFRAREMHVTLDRDHDGVPEDYWFDVLHHPLVEADGHIESLITVATDITAQVAADREVKHQWRMFDVALSNTPDYIYVFDSDGHFTYANKPFTTLFGRSMDQIVGKSFAELSYPPDLAEKLTGQIQEVFTTRTTLWDETLFAGVDGIARSYEYIFTPICREDGSVEAVAGSSRDITDRKRAVDGLRRSNEELVRINRELEEFAFVASHDLQEPLRMVGAYTQLMLRRIAPHERERLNPYANFIRKGVEKMEELIQDLLLFSRVVHTERLPVETADLGGSLQSALVALKTQIEENAAVIRTTALPIVSGDESQLSHVFQNLISNSLKYRRTEVRPEIDISAAFADGHWTICVRDNGIGFEQQYAERIFGLFKRLHKDQYPGTGLGLAICQRIVERYGGHMWAKGELGTGSRFYFSLPAASAEVA